MPPDATEQSLTAAFCAAGDLAALRRCCAALADGTDKTDQPRGRIIARWCEDEAGRPAMLAAYLDSFLTQEGDIRARLFTKAAAKKAGIDLAGILAVEAERAKRFRDARNALVVIEATRALVRLGAALVKAYEARKRLHAELDYDDLVLKALALLRRPGIAPWVLFKLDGGLDHILIDEAQDTNPEQWQIVAVLAAEFFAGEDPLGRMRTVFAVGDAKQSIYSFQRADPSAFTRMRAHFQRRVVDANRVWRPVPLDISFRAAEPLLRAVDAVFSIAATADGVAFDGEAIRHVAARLGQAGLVELWPGAPTPPEEADDLEASDAPRGAANAHTRLAAAIAATIEGWLAHGEPLPSRDRPVRAGDIMVLVRRRNAFVEDLLRELKQRNVPVAGADRLTLSEQLAVKDLVALGQFLLLPEDDLTLAAVLKGPLFGVSEEQLFTLAYDRGGRSLWSRLLRRAGGDLLLSRAVETLRGLLARADFAPPYELYADILGAQGGRRAMLERLGPEAEDPIEEFLVLALTYEREHVPSLQGFLHWLVAGDIEVKRDLAEQQRDEVRIMTVHGAKGLEAPVVFLPDTMQLPDQRGQLLWTEADGLPLWRPHRDFACGHYTAERQALRRRELQEYRRLLYVALTRAQDRLYVCGWQTRNTTKEAETWHTLCRAGLTGIAESFEFDATALIGETDGWAGEGLRLETAADRRRRRAICRAPPRRARRPAGLARSASARRARSAETAAAVAAERQRAGDLVAARRRGPRPVQARSSDPPVAANLARIASRRARGGGPAIPRAAGPRARAGRAGGHLPRDHRGARNPRIRPALGTGRAGRGAGRRTDRRPRAVGSDRPHRRHRRPRTDRRLQDRASAATERGRGQRRLSAAACQLSRRARTDLSGPAGGLRDPVDRSAAPDADQPRPARTAPALTALFRLP